MLLSDVDALYSRPPGEPGAEKIDFVTYGDDLSGIEIGSIGSAGVGTGGAETKIAAAMHANNAGIPVILTSAANIGQALSGDSVGTWFEASSR